MFRNVQLLRALGAVLVLLLHYHLHYLDMGGSNPLLTAVMTYGFVGVDIFFAISGFVMMHVIGSRRPTAANVHDFLGRRVLRIYGWYLPCMVFALALMAVWDPPGFDRVNLLRSATLTSVDLQWLALPVSWSLSYELYFYAMVALGWVLFRARLRGALWVSMGLLAVWCALVPYREGTLRSFLTSPFILEFLAGALCYLYKDNLARKPLLPLYALATVVLVWLGVHYQAGNDFLRIRTFGAAAVCLMCFFVTLEQTGLYRAGRLAMLLGDASYSIYLLHLPFLSVLYHSGLRKLLASYGPAVAELGFAAYILAFLALCIGLHTLVERPLYRWLCRLLRLRHGPTPVNAVAA